MIANEYTVHIRRNTAAGPKIITYKQKGEIDMVEAIKLSQREHREAFGIRGEVVEAIKR